jgi:hypothetical protein
MRIISKDSRCSERLGDDFRKLLTARDRTPWFLVEVKLRETSRSCGVNQSSIERGRCFAPGAYSVGFLLKPGSVRRRHGGNPVGCFLFFNLFGEPSQREAFPVRQE